MAISIIIPWRPGCHYREQALSWVEARLSREFPEAEILQARDSGQGSWIKAAAVESVSPSHDVVAVSDADVWTPGLERAVYAVICGQADWAVPHRMVHRLSEDGTAAVLAGEPWEAQAVDQRPYEGVLGGGILVARRETFCAAPLDSRFQGWGNEDESQALALNTLFGRPWRGTADLVHLWHPPQERMTRRRGSQESWSLRGRYLEARHDPEAMRRLLEEGRCLSPA